MRQRTPVLMMPSSRCRSCCPVIRKVRYTGTNGSARKFVQEMETSGTVDTIRKEPGNLRYEYWISFDDPETVLLIDFWVGQAAIDAHYVSPMVKAIAGLHDKYDLHMTFEHYVSEEAGMPAVDQKLIRR